MKPAPIKETISFEEFEKLDVRVGTIVAVFEVEGSRKLMKLEVDFGDHVRSVLAGIRQERENPREIEGKQALFVVNLPEAGTYYVGAREGYGDSPAPDELFGMYDESADHGLTVNDGDRRDDLRIVVEPVAIF